MFPLSLLNPKLIAVLVIVAAVLGGVWYVQHLQSRVETLSSELEIETSKNRVLTAELRALTEAKAAVEARVKQADDTRAKISADLAATLKRLKAKPVPAACPDQIDWLWEQAK